MESHIFSELAKRLADEVIEALASQAMGEAMGLKIILPARGAACISSSSANSIKGNVRTLVYDKGAHDP